MTDKRENILTYLATLLKVDGIAQVYRDRGDLTAFQRPAVVLLDGTEELLTEIKGQAFTSMPAAVFSLKPEIFLITASRDDASNLTLNSVSAPIGPELSSWRVKIIKAVTTDINLVAMLGPNGQVQYNGCETDMRNENTLEGMIFFHFSFSYVLDPNKL